MNAIKAKLKTEEAPAPDFAIFGPHGKILQKEKRFQAQLFINGEYVTKQLHGPANLQDWLLSWRVFRTAMLMHKAARVSTLDAYERGIKSLSDMYPHAWGYIVIADELCRTEQWDKLYDLFEEEHPSHFKEDQPWDTVIFHSVWGTITGPLSHWLRQRLEHPTGLVHKDAQGDSGCM